MEKSSHQKVNNKPYSTNAYNQQAQIHVGNYTDVSFLFLWESQPLPPRTTSQIIACHNIQKWLFFGVANVDDTSSISLLTHTLVFSS